MPDEKVSRYNLVTGEDSYAQQNAQNPATSRRVLGWIVSDDGSITREWNEPKYLPTQLPGEVKALFEFDQEQANGTTNRYYFAAAATAPGASTFNLYQNVAGAWVQVTAVGTLQAPPQVVQNVGGDSLLHLTDGTTNWLFDGTNWVKDGFIIPLGGVAIDTGTAGTFSCSVGRYYWYSNSDQTASRIHESDSSPISFSTGALTNKKVKVYQQLGLFSATLGSPTINTSNSTDNPGPVNPNLGSWMVGMAIYINGQLIGTIASVGAGTLTLTANSAFTITNGRAVICDPRATHWNIYASETDGSKIGQLLASVPVTQNLNTTPYQDQSPFIGQANTLFFSIFRPVRNDPPPPSKIVEVHKYRIWRRRESKPSFFNFTANEEVIAGANGAPSQSVPGADVNTLSDIVNENPYPDTSRRIQAMKSHADALYIFTEKNGLPLYGESIDDFDLSQISAFNVGAAGRFAAISTPHGLIFVSYDRNVFLFPTANYPWAYVPKNVNVTDSLIDIGKPIVKKLEKIAFSQLDEIKLSYYRFGRRDWLVLCFIDTNNVWHTWVYEFKTKTWFELAKGVSSAAVFEVSAGVQVLVGGGTDGYVYVLDDMTGTYASTGN